MNGLVDGQVNGPVDSLVNGPVDAVHQTKIVGLS